MDPGICNVSSMWELRAEYEMRFQEEDIWANQTDLLTSLLENCSMWFAIHHPNGGNLTNGIIYEDPAYFSYSYRIIGTFFQSIILLVGVLGNAMVVLVVAKTKSMRSPTNCYLVSLAIADCVALIASIPQEIVSYYLVGSQWIWGDVGCALLIFLQNLGINASSLSLTAFTIER